MSWSKERPCVDCGVDISARHYHAKVCLACSEKRGHASTNRYLKTSEKAKAHHAIRSITRVAVRVCFLPEPRTLKCMDCGKPAECYDHRDYNKPLEVEPVCIRCNSSRGTGVPFNHIDLPAIKAAS